MLGPELAASRRARRIRLAVERTDLVEVPLVEPADRVDAVPRRRGQDVLAALAAAQRIHRVEGVVEADGVEAGEVVDGVPEREGRGGHGLVMFQDVHHPAEEAQVLGPAVQDRVELAVVGLALLPPGRDGRDGSLDVQAAHDGPGGREEPLGSARSCSHHHTWTG